MSTSGPVDRGDSGTGHQAQSDSARKLRAIYARVPGAPFLRREFGFYSLDRWRAEGHIPPDATMEELRPIFLLDPPGNHSLGQLGWCEAAFLPRFEEKVVEDRGEYEVVQDRAGRRVLCFKGRRSGFMPTYLDHPVKDWKTWEEDVKPRLDPDAPGRHADLTERMAEARRDADRGLRITQDIIGGYMFLRSLIGPEDVLLAFYDMPDLIHDCMQAWLRLAEAVVARHQQHVTLDEMFFAEDICYNHGPLISPDMMREFLFPYYQQLVGNARSRQIDPSRRLFVHVDSDGDVRPIIPLYRDAVGIGVMSPFEVASGCDVLDIAQRYSDLVMFGGIDKRVLASGPAAIDRTLERILPAMRERGGYIPTCDHGVPAEVPFNDYLHYRRRCVELGG